MIDIFHYPQDFSRDIIESTFKKVFQKAGNYYKDEFLDTYEISNDDFEKYLKTITIFQDNPEISKNVSMTHLKGDKHFDSYFIAYLYYKLSNGYSLTKPIANAILKFHIKYKVLHEQEEDSDISSLVRYFVHIVEMAQVYYLSSKYFMEIKNFKFTSNPKQLTLLDFKYYRMENSKKSSCKEISITDIIDAIEVKKIVLKSDENDCSFRFMYENQIYCVKSNITVKNLKLTGFKTVFLKYYNKAIKRTKKSSEYEEKDTTDRNKKYVDNDIFITKAKKNQDSISKEDRIEEDNQLKESMQVKLGKNNVKSKQKKRIQAISAAIAKNKLLLPSLYTLPSIGVLSKFLQYLLSEDIKISAEKEFYIGVFVLAIVMGIKPEQVNRRFFVSKKEYTNDNNTVKLKLNTDLFAKFEQFDEKTGVKTQMEVEYKIPFELIHYMQYLRKLSIQFNDKAYKKAITECNKDFKKAKHHELKIRHSKIYNSAIVHKQLIHKTVNTEVLLATENIDQNITPRIAYTVTSSNLSEYSLWLSEYVDLFGIKAKIQKKVFGQVLSNSQPTVINTKYPLVGSKKIVEKDAFIIFLNQIETILKKERRLDRYTRFNLYSIYVRFSLSLLLGTRDFKQSVDFDRISWSLNILMIKEKGKYKNSGYREIPLTPLGKQIIKNYLETLKKLNINNQAVVLYDNDKAIPATIANIKKVFYLFRFSQKYTQLGEQFDAIALNFGRHLITTIATNMNIEQDDLNAFMGHGINGGEVLGIYSFHDIGAYRKKFTELIGEIEKVYKIKDIINAARI